MSHALINPLGWPKPKGYSNGILAAKGRTLFMAGQVGWDANERFASDALVPQFAQALRNILAIVRQAGGAPKHICRMTCYCKDRDQYLATRGELRGVWKELMGDHYPCMSMLFVVDLLDHPAVIEIEATAVIPDPA